MCYLAVSKSGQREQRIDGTVGDAVLGQQKGDRCIHAGQPRGDRVAIVKSIAMPIHSSGVLAVGPASPTASFCALGTAGEERILQTRRVDVNLF